MDKNLVILKSPHLSVAENIALDKELMLAVSKNQIPEHLRFYDISDEAIVLGLAQDPNKTVNPVNSANANLTILKRFSGGGTVFVSKGSLTFSVIIKNGPDLPKFAVEKAYDYIFNPLMKVFKENGLELEYHPPCDLAIKGLKIAGTAQAQKKNCVLIHGCILINEDFDRIERLLQHPPEEPRYRKGRLHAEFLANLADFGLNQQKVADLLIEAWANKRESISLAEQFVQIAKVNSADFKI